MTISEREEIPDTQCYSVNEEQTPLLTKLLPKITLSSLPNNATSSSFALAIIYFMTIHFLLAFAEVILIAPLIRLFENSLCLAHFSYPEGGIGESSCKIPEIQRPLATIRGWKSMLDTIPVLLVAVPLGRIGDRIGRRKIMILSLVGVAGSLVEIFVVCAFPAVFPLRLVWLSSVILLCGGGLNSASAFMWAMASESIPSERRSHAFYYIFSAFYVAELVASFTAFVTTDISPWIPCGLALGSIVLCLLLLTLVSGPLRLHSTEQSTIGMSSQSEGALYSLPNILPRSSQVDGLCSALSNANVLFLIPVFLVGIFRYTTLNVLIQYASVRFGLKISTGATFYTETAIVNIFLFLFIVPQLTELVRRRYDIDPQVIDLTLVRTSVVLMCIGALSIGLLQNVHLLPIGVFVFSAGFGSRVSALSLISYWIADSSKATVYASITVLESLGHAVGDPSMLHILAASLGFSAFWQALPFFFAATFYLVAVISSSFIQTTAYSCLADQQSG